MLFNQFSDQITFDRLVLVSTVYFLKTYRLSNAMSCNINLRRGKEIILLNNFFFFRKQEDKHITLQQIINQACGVDSTIFCRTFEIRVLLCFLMDAKVL